MNRAPTRDRERQQLNKPPHPPPPVPRRTISLYIVTRPVGASTLVAHPLRRPVRWSGLHACLAARSLISRQVKSSQAESRQAYSSQTCPTAVQLRSLYRAPCSLLPAELPARVLASSPSSPVQSSHVGAPCPSDRILPLALSPVPPTLHTALLTVPAVTRLADRP